VSGFSVVNLSGGTIAAGGSCTFSVNVVGSTGGHKVNTTGTVTSANAGSGNQATATIDVLAPDPTITKTHQGTFNRNQQGAEFVSLCETLVRDWEGQRHRFYRRTGKRIFDLLLSIPLTAILIPALAGIAALVKLSSPGPVFFNQCRLGKLGHIFLAYKFRTMVHRERTQHVEIRAGNPEVTPVGEFLRRFKLDELPQLLNVLKGDMSLVGPRPPLPEQMAEYDSEIVKRLHVRPGLTGLAQIHGGTRMIWPERWQYDLRYVRDLSLLLDLRILARTVLVVVLGESRFHTPPRPEE